MPPDQFEDELRELVTRWQGGVEELQAKVAELFRKHGREVPPPITGTMAITDPEDKFGA
jgi:hypothetical protein